MKSTRKKKKKNTKKAVQALAGAKSGNASNETSSANDYVCETQNDIHPPRAYSTAAECKAEAGTFEAKNELSNNFIEELPRDKLAAARADAAEQPNVVLISNQDCNSSACKLDNFSDSVADVAKEGVAVTSTDDGEQNRTYKKSAEARRRYRLHLKAKNFVLNSVILGEGTFWK